MSKSSKFVTTSICLLVLTLMVHLNINAQPTNPPSNAQNKTVFEVISANQGTSDFAELLKTFGYDELLQKSGRTFTVLAPKNSVLEASYGTAGSRDDIEEAMQFMRNHQFLFHRELSSEFIESFLDVKVLDEGISANNGIVYIVDRLVEG